MTKEGEEVPAQEEERRGGGSRRKEGRERGAGVPGSRLCSGPRCAEDAPRGTWDIAGLEVQRGARPQPGGVLRLRGFCTAYVLSGAFFSPRRLLFFVGAASPFAAARKIGKLPEEAWSAQPRAPLREASGNRGSARPETSLATRSAWWGGLGLPSGRRDSCRLRAWGGAAGSGSRQPFLPGRAPGSVSVPASGERLNGKRDAGCDSACDSARGLSGPRGRPGTPVSIRRFPSWNGEWGSFAATSQRLR